MYRCVKMKVEVGRQWGKVADKFKWVVEFEKTKYITDSPRQPTIDETASDSQRIA